MLLGEYLAYTNDILRKWSFDKEYIKSDMSNLPAWGMIWKVKYWMKCIKFSNGAS